MSGDHRHRVHTGDRRRLRAALIAGVLCLVAAYAAFVRTLPFTHSFEIRGVFTTANQLRSGDEVRRAGVRIGKVTGIDPGPGNTSIVTMRLDNHDHLQAGAGLAIRERLLFEGNLYVDVIPGTRTAPPLADGATIPLTRTTVPVQLDQVLDTLDRPVRQALTGTIKSLGDGLGRGADRLPSGAAGLRRATRELHGALGGIARAAKALRGTRSGDLHRAVGSARDFTAEMARDPAALADLVTSFNRVAGALSADAPALSATVRQLDAVLGSASPSLAKIDIALPHVTEFAHVLLPALRAVPPNASATTGLLRQLRLAATRDTELPGFVAKLRPVSTGLRRLEPSLARELSLVNHLGQCLNNTLLPVAKTQIPDGPNTTGYPIWKDTLHLGANLLGASAGFDGNGGTLRLGLSEGANVLQEHIPGIGELIGMGQIEGVNPLWLGAGVQPEYRPDAWCEDQRRPNFGARARIGLPPNFAEVPARRLSKRERARQKTVLELMTGTRADRGRLLEMLLKELPLSPKRPQQGRLGKRPLRRPVKTVAISPPRAPAPTTPQRADGADGGPVGPVGSTVKKLLDRLLGGGAGR